VNTEEQPGTEQPGAEGPAPEAGQPSQEELRARLEQQLRKLKVQDLLVESVVSVLNLTARRIAKEDERDLEQARVGIEAVRAWVGLLPEEAAKQIQNALSELQVLYAQATEGSGPEEPEADQGEPERETPTREPEEPSGGARKPPPGLWTPPGST
jgi:hypothetical protein